MEKFKEILLEVWREACKDIEIETSCASISRILLNHMPLRQVLVCEANTNKRCFETIAIGFKNSGVQYPVSLTNFIKKDWDKAVKTLADREILHKNGHPEDWHVMDGFTISKTKDYDLLIGPLRNGNVFLGVLILLSEEGVFFAEKHVEMMKILLEPFSIALRNDLNLHEINILREAAEADKNSLLQRLSRKSISDTIIGADSGLLHVMERVKLVARSDVPVMILGETGTGKELISREIHRLSSHKNGPFIRVNCGSIPAELIDSQLFGHEKGAFTGAFSTHKGWFERADGGTLFLDEIGELPLAGQVRLLRIIQDGWLERVGGKQPIHVDVRLVIATHRDLAEMVQTGQFREDLWYRLSVFPILLPALKDRIQDIPALANHFADRAAIRFHLPVQLPTQHDIELLSKYPWPGNIRELSSVINRAAILGNGQSLKVDVSLGWMEKPEGIQSNRKKVLPSEQDSTSVTFDEMIRLHIENTLRQTRGRVEGPSGAATLLKINPNTLRAKMRKLGIDWKKYRSVI